jgi:hypothetical protein
MRIGVEALARLGEQWADQRADSTPADQDAIGLKALTTYCHAIINSAAFLYVD